MNCLFCHDTRDIFFSLIVSAISVQYTDNADFVPALSNTVNKVHLDWTGDRFLGITLAWDYTARKVTASMPKALQCYNFDRSQRKVHSPGAYVQPQYGTHQQLVEMDDSDPLSPNDFILLQSIISTFLWYCRVLDSTGLVAHGQLAQSIAHPTDIM